MGLMITPEKRTGNGEMEKQERKGNEGEDRKRVTRRRRSKKCQGAKRMAPMEMCLEMILVVNWNVHWGELVVERGRTDLWRWLLLA
jgi:hypothetical protein